VTALSANRSTVRELVAELKRFLKPAGVPVPEPGVAATSAATMEPDGPVPPDVAARRPELLGRLRAERETVWPRLRQTMDMGEIEEFARRLQAWAEAGHLPALSAYGATLLEQLEAFDVDRLPKTLEDFPSVCESMSCSIA